MRQLPIVLLLQSHRPSLINFLGFFWSHLAMLRSYFWHGIKRVVPRHAEEPSSFGDQIQVSYRQSICSSPLSHLPGSANAFKFMSFMEEMLCHGNLVMFIIVKCWMMASGSSKLSSLSFVWQTTTSKFWAGKSFVQNHTARGSKFKVEGGSLL